MQFSDMLSRISEPQTILMAKKTRELKAQGIDITDLTLGEPDFKTPQYIIDAAITAMNEGYTKYPPVAGFPELRQAICDKLKQENNLEYLPEQTIVSTGAKQVLANVVLSLINPGDEAIIPTPFWVTYASQVALANGVCKYISCGVTDNFKLSPEKLEAAISPKTKLFIFSSPCNPSGAVYSKAELEALKNVFVKYPDITIISDEIYEYINYTGKHESIAQFPEIKDRVALVNGFSKGFAMTGWRLGYLAANKELVSNCEKLQSQVTSGANAIAQRAGIAALRAGRPSVTQIVQAFKERKKYFIGALSNMKGIHIYEPEGAFYAFPDISSFFGKTDGNIVINNADDFAMYMLTSGHVAGVTGSAFGDDNCVRFSFATSMDNLKIAVDKIQQALHKLHN